MRARVALAVGVSVAGHVGMMIVVGSVEPVERREVPREVDVEFITVELTDETTKRRNDETTEHSGVGSGIGVGPMVAMSETGVGQRAGAGADSGAGAGAGADSGAGAGAGADSGAGAGADSGAGAGAGAGAGEKSKPGWWGSAVTDRFRPGGPAVPSYDPRPTEAPGVFDNGLRPKFPKTEWGLPQKLDEGPYVARTRPDGKVVFEDKPNVRIKLPSAAGIGRHLESWADDPYGTSKNTPKVSVTSPTGEGETIQTVQVLGGGFDLTDALMRSKGQDPYSAKKLAFMDRTRDERAGKAKTEEREQLREALPALGKDLRRVWASKLPAAERRAVLFEMWDECAESGSDQVVVGAKRARATIVAFIRERLPEGSAQAYTAAELRKLNARRTSKQRFSPYMPGK